MILMRPRDRIDADELPRSLFYLATSYTTYLAPSSPSEINVHSTLRNELISYLTLVLASEFTASSSGFGARAKQTTRGALALHPRQSSTSARATQANQLQVIVGLYERAQKYIFKGMAADSVPKVRSTSRPPRITGATR